MVSDEKDTAQSQLAQLPVKVGQRYCHYKGGEYEIIALAVKEDTLEPLVIYRSLDKLSTWARVYSNWSEQVEINGRLIPRFSLITH